MYKTKNHPTLKVAIGTKIKHKHPVAPLFYPREMSLRRFTIAV
jgi:hypothetical protein